MRISKSKVFITSAFLSLLLVFASVKTFAANIPEHLYIIGSTIKGDNDFSDKHTFLEHSNGILACLNVSVYPTTPTGTFGELVITETCGENWKNGPVYSIQEGSLNNYGTALKIFFDAISVPEGTYDFYIDFNGSVPRLYYFTVNQRIPQHLYLLGSLKEPHVLDIEGLEFERQDNMFILKDVDILAGDTGNTFGSIALCNSNGEDWLKLCYVPVSKITASSIEENASYSTSFVKANSENEALFMLPVGRYDLYVDFSNLFPELSIIQSPKIETGIDSANIETKENYEYYTLDGVRVSNPSVGLYIRRGLSSSRLVWL